MTAATVTQFPCGDPRTPENTVPGRKYAECLSCHRARARRYQASKRQTSTPAADRCSGTGGRGCQCPYHTWRRSYKAERRKTASAIARVQTTRHLAPPKQDAKTGTARRYITTPTIQQIIAECRPLYLRAIEPKKGRAA